MRTSLLVAASVLVARLSALDGWGACSPDISGPEAIGPDWDHSGTNPFVLLREFDLSGAFEERFGDGHRALLDARAALPFAGCCRIAADIPCGWTTIEDDAVGFGDATTQLDVVADRSGCLGLLIGVALVAPTSGDDALGDGKWQVGPVATIGWPLGDGLVALTYRQRISYAGDVDREDVNRADIELRVLKAAPDGFCWMVLTPTLTIDYHDENRAWATIPIEFGHLVLPDVAVFVTPAFGIGAGRPYDVAITGGVRMVGW